MKPKVISLFWCLKSEGGTFLNIDIKSDTVSSKKEEQKLLKRLEKAIKLYEGGIA